MVMGIIGWSGTAMRLDISAGTLQNHAVSHRVELLLCALVRQEVPTVGAVVTEVKRGMAVVSLPCSGLPAGR